MIIAIMVQMMDYLTIKDQDQLIITMAIMKERINFNSISQGTMFI
jgi:hypothetical protein